MSNNNPKAELVRNHSLTYNSQKQYLGFPEYGRNIQEMVFYAKAIKDLEQRQAHVEAIVQLMYQMNPQSKNVDDYKDKLWKHVFEIAEYQLGGVLMPNGQVPTPEAATKRPEAMGYPVVNHRFRHYGNHVSLMIQKALSLEEGPIKDGYVSTIGSYMKLAYKTWNKEHYVSDDIIKTDLELLSDGKLTLDDDANFNALGQANRRRSNDTRNTGRDNRGGTSNYRSNDRSNDRRDNRSGGTSTNYRSNDRTDNRSSGGTSTNYRSNDRNDNRGGGTNNNNNDRRRDNTNDRTNSDRFKRR